jgi:hypothetical protein
MHLGRFALRNLAIVLAILSSGPSALSAGTLATGTKVQMAVTSRARHVHRASVSRTNQAHELRVASEREHAVQIFDAKPFYIPDDSAVSTEIGIERPYARITVLPKSLRGTTFHFTGEVGDDSEQGFSLRLNPLSSQQIYRVAPTISARLHGPNWIPELTLFIQRPAIAPPEAVMALQHMGPTPREHVGPLWRLVHSNRSETLDGSRVAQTGEDVVHIRFPLATAETATLILDQIEIEMSFNYAD